MSQVTPSFDIGLMVNKVGSRYVSGKRNFILIQFLTVTSSNVSVYSTSLLFFFKSLQRLTNLSVETWPIS